MCNSAFNHRLAPLNERHLERVIEIFPEQAEFARKLFKVLTNNLTPQANLFVAFVLLKKQYESGIRGIFDKILYAPLSIVAKTGEHEWTRFRPKPVDELHTSFLSFMMAKPNRINLNRLLGNYGLRFSQSHCCGILFGKVKDVDDFEQSELFKTRNKMRSYAEAMAMPVVEIDFEGVPFVTSDLGFAEREFYEAYEQVFDHIGVQPIEDYKMNSAEDDWNAIIVSQVSSSLSSKKQTKGTTSSFRVAPFK